MRDLLLECAIAISEEEVDGIIAHIGNSHVEMMISVEIIDDDILRSRVVSDPLMLSLDECSLTCLI